METVLSLFPGIGILDRGFEKNDFSVVRGPDLIWGGDIRRFNINNGVFNGIIGGSPCQDFSKAKRKKTQYSYKMLEEFERIVKQGRPEWWLLENVPGVPDLKIDGYNWQRLDIRSSDFGLSQSRLRHVQFGSLDDTVLLIERKKGKATRPTVMASDRETPLHRMCLDQGLPIDFNIPAFTAGAVRRAVGNAVSYPVALALAKAVRNRIKSCEVRLCQCLCGRLVEGRKRFANGACRKRNFDRKVTIREDMPSAP